MILNPGYHLNIISILSRDDPYVDQITIALMNNNIVMTIPNKIAIIYMISFFGIILRKTISKPWTMGWYGISYSWPVYDIELHQTWSSVAKLVDPGTPSGQRLGGSSAGGGRCHRRGRCLERPEASSRGNGPNLGIIHGKGQLFAVLFQWL